MNIKVCGSLFKSHNEKIDIDDLAKCIAGTKVRNLMDPNTDFKPMFGEIEFEKRQLRKTGQRASGILYDGFKLMDAYRSLLPNFFPDDELHLIFTDRLLGTFDENDRRYHARVIVCGLPSMISTTGIIEAPAKPREFYRIKEKYARLNMLDRLDDIKKEFKGRFIDHDDARLTDIAKGYAMQAVFHHLISEPFCDNRNCRLFNAHWQEDMIHAQLEGPDLCERHAGILVGLSE